MIVFFGASLRKLEIACEQQNGERQSEDHQRQAADFERAPDREHTPFPLAGSSPAPKKAEACWQAGVRETARSIDMTTPPLQARRIRFSAPVFSLENYPRLR